MAPVGEQWSRQRPGLDRYPGINNVLGSELVNFIYWMLIRIVIPKIQEPFIMSPDYRAVVWKGNPQMLWLTCT
jgi:hypothetical protein